MSKFMIYLFTFYASSKQQITVDMPAEWRPARFVPQPLSAHMAEIDSLLPITLGWPKLTLRRVTRALRMELASAFESPDWDLSDRGRPSAGLRRHKSRHPMNRSFISAQGP
jgi:hypothetical protein